MTSTENILVEGSHIAADVNNAREGDVNFAAGNNVTIKEATDSYDSDSKEIHGTAELSVVVQHQAVEVAKAVIAVDDAKDQLEQAKKDYKKYEKDLDNLQNTLSALEADYAKKTPGVSYEDILELRELVGDVKGDKEWYVAGVALAAANLTAKTTALVQQTAAAAQSTATWGFNAGLQLDIEASKTTTSIKETTAVASTVSGNNINIQTGTGKDSAEGTATNIGGSHLQADNSLAINTGELNITASKNTQEIDSNTEQGHITAQMTVYGAAAGGVSVNADFSRSKNSETHTTINNSTLSADNIQLTTAGDTNIRGGNIHADSTLVADIGGDLNVESLQNRSRTKNNSAGISGGLSASGGTTTGVNGGINASNGMSTTRETVRSSLTSGGTADITVAGNTQITAATIATIDEDGNDLGNLNLNTGSLSFTDLRDTHQSHQTSGGISTSLNVGGTTATEASQGQQLATDSQGRELDPNTSNITYSNNSQYDASKALATLGNGNITVGGKTDSEENPHESLTGLNRDTTNTTKELWSVERQEGNVDLAIDHRMLSDEGRKEIKDDVRVTVEGTKTAINTVKTEFKVITTNLPDDKKQLGPLMENHLDEIIRLGGDVQAFMDMVDNPEYQAFAMNLLEMRGSVDQQGVAAFDVNAIADQVTSFINPNGSITDVRSVQDPMGIGLLQNLSEAQAYLAGLPAEQAQIAMLSISTIAGGPVKTLVQYGKDAALEYASADVQAKLNNWVANGIGGIAHGTTGEAYAFYSNPETLAKIESTYDKMLAYQAEYGAEPLTPEDRKTFYDMEDYLSSPLAERVRTETQSTAAGAQLASTILIGSVAAVGATGKSGNENNNSHQGMDSDNRVDHSVGSENNDPYTGGPHKETSQPVGDGLDSHHCPAKTCYKNAPISSQDGPAIKMEPGDHRQTASYGGSPEAKAYRERQKKLIDEGKVREALQMDINDLRSKFGNKYDSAIKEMGSYLDTLNPQDFINQ